MLAFLCNVVFFHRSNSGMATPSDISTVTGGMETPDMLELRKKKIEDAMEGLVLFALNRARV